MQHATALCPPRLCLLDPKLQAPSSPALLLNLHAPTHPSRLRRIRNADATDTVSLDPVSASSSTAAVNDAATPRHLRSPSLNLRMKPSEKPSSSDELERSSRPNDYRTDTRSLLPRPIRDDTAWSWLIRDDGSRVAISLFEATCHAWRIGEHENSRSLSRENRALAR